MLNVIPGMPATPTNRRFHPRNGTVTDPQRRKRSFRRPLQVIRSNQLLDYSTHVSPGQRPRILPRASSLNAFQLLQTSPQKVKRNVARNKPHNIVHVARDEHPKIVRIAHDEPSKAPSDPTGLPAYDSIISDATGSGPAVLASSPLVDVSNRSPPMRRVSLPRMVFSSPPQQTAFQPASPVLLSRLGRMTSSAKLRENRRPREPSSGSRRALHGPRDFGSGFKAGGVKPGRDQTSYRYKLSVRVFGCGFKSGWAFGAGARGAESWFESDLIPAGGLMHPGFRLGRTECFIGNTLIKYYNRADVTIDGEAHKYRPE